MVEFPREFLWGAATSSYQVEGNNSNADWWQWELSQKNITPSGQACRHYELFREDFDLAKSLSHNAHRLSVEWSRIQPREGEFSREALDHYHEVIRYLRKLQIEPIVTLHHFTNPAWFARQGGWSSARAVASFLTFAEKVVEELAEDVTYWVTINEPMVYVYFSFLAGRWPPQERSLSQGKAAADNMASAHIKAYRLIRAIYRKKNIASPRISIAHHMAAFVPCRETLRNRFIASLRHWSFNLRLVNGLARRKTLDFIGLNYYTRHLIDAKQWSLNEIVNNECGNHHDTLPKNSLGWEIYPQGLADVLVSLKKYNLPVFILENGICTEDDSQRWDFIRQHVASVYRAMGQGVDVIGYLYWSLLDNFEWDYGFGPRFGLCEVDYTTFKRTVRESAKKFARVCQTGKLSE